MSTLWFFFVSTGLITSIYATKEDNVFILDESVPEDFDCPMRQLALEFAMKIQPFLSKDQLQEIADALNGAQESINKSCVIVPSDWKLKHKQAPKWNDLDVGIIDDTASIYVDFNKGNDLNNGSITSPLKHLDQAIEICRKYYGSNVYKRIILREGRHYLRKTIEITSSDNNLLITNFNNELVELSGGIPLNCKWIQTSINPNNNIYKCFVTEDINDILGLRVNGSRAIRARYPNGNPEVYPCGFCSNNKATAWLPPTCNPEPIKEYLLDSPLRNDSSLFQKYQLGIGGCCDIYSPNSGYYCGNHTQGGGADTFVIPSGLIINQTILPHIPYNNISGGIIQTWRPSHWCTWMFLLDESKYNQSTIKENGTFYFKKGGFQGAHGNLQGDEFYIENIMEELDIGNEYFYNLSTKTLYYFINNTNINISDLVFESTNLKVLVNYTGTMNKPVRNQVIRGIIFRDTQYTYLDAHGMPSGGDWGLQRQGAIYLDGVENITVSTNVLTRLDGNAISVNRYARNVVIYKNEIVWNGDNGVSMWGDTQNITFGDGTTMGYDGTNGNQPRGTQFIQNYVHEIGIWQKQSSMWFQAKSCSNLLEGNIFFNGPRAGINFNDGFGGNSTLRNNLLFNTCRESGDHGPFNSWDRQVYLTKVRDGSTPSVIKAYDYIYSNFIIANYNSQDAIDNDDGSCYYITYSNFLVYGINGMKNDYGGHDNIHYNNIYGYVHPTQKFHCFMIVGTIKGHQDEFYNNTCIHNGAFSNPPEYGRFDCGKETETNQWPKLGNNTIYIANPKGVNYTDIGLCGLTEKEFQKTYPGVDDGTVIINGPPNSSEVISNAKVLLGMAIN